MKILVTGGAGFIGSHLCERLIKLGNEVVAIDNLSTGNIHNLEALQDNKRFQLIVEDIRNDGIVEQLVQQAEQVYHLAAAVGVRLIIDQPVNTIETNIRGTEVVLRAAAKFQRKTILTSTSEVYGKNPNDSFSEDDDSIIGPSSRARWAYATSKLIDEFLAQAYHSEMGLKTICVRLFNTVGPRQTGRYGMVLPTFARQALLGEPVTVFGTGEQSRCFSHVDDVIEGMLKLMQAHEAEGEIFNIGNPGNEITMNELAERIVQRTKSKSEIVHIPYDQAYSRGFEDMQRRKPDIAKLAKVTGFKPKHDLDECIDGVVKDIRKKVKEN